MKVEITTAVHGQIHPGNAGYAAVVVINRGPQPRRDGRARPFIPPGSYTVEGGDPNSTWEETVRAMANHVAKSFTFDNHPAINGTAKPKDPDLHLHINAYTQDSETAGMLLQAAQEHGLTNFHAERLRQTPDALTACRGIAKHHAKRAAISGRATQTYGIASPHA